MVLSRSVGMPIPYYVPENSLVDISPRLQLLAAHAPAAKPVSLHISARFCAHVLDASLVMGISAYSSKLIALAFLSIYSSEFEAFGRGANGVFAEAYDYANGQLLGACAAFFGTIYFVALPAWNERTLGMGLMGLKFVADDGSKPSVHALSRRFLSCVLVYVSGGLLLLSSLRGRASRLPQDTFSGTTVKRI
jgi:uncharacterized RDD family membrane protein YckC